MMLGLQKFSGHHKYMGRLGQTPCPEGIAILWGRGCYEADEVPLFLGPDELTYHLSCFIHLK